MSSSWAEYSFQLSTLTSAYNLRKLINIDYSSDVAPLIILRNGVRIFYLSFERCQCVHHNSRSAAAAAWNITISIFPNTIVYNGQPDEYIIKHNMPIAYNFLATGLLGRSQISNSIQYSLDCRFTKLFLGWYIRAYCSITGPITTSSCVHRRMPPTRHQTRGRVNSTVGTATRAFPFARVRSQPTTNA